MQRFSLISKKSENGEEHVSVCSEETLVRKLKNETKAGFITKLRDARLYSGYTSRSLLQQIQRIYPSVVYAKKKDGRCFFQQYNGVVLLEVNHLRNDDDISHVKQGAKEKVWSYLFDTLTRMALCLLKRLKPRSSMNVLTWMHVCPIRKS